MAHLHSHRCCSTYPELKDHGGDRGGAGDRWEGTSQPLLIKYGCVCEGQGELQRRPDEGQEKVRGRRMSGPGHSTRGRKPTDWASTSLKVDPWAGLGLSTEAFQGGAHGCLWLWTSKLSLQWQVLCSPHPSLYSGQVSMEERCGPFPPLMCPWQTIEPPSLSSLNGLSSPQST